MTIAFFDISGGEIFVILLVVFIIFGPDKIPEIARWIGKSVNEIKRATSEITDEISKETKDIREAADKLKDDIHKTTREITKTVEDTGKDLRWFESSVGRVPVALSPALVFHKKENNFSVESPRRTFVIRP